MTEDEAKTKWPLIGRLGWRSGHSKGYMRCKCPTHPNASKDGYVYEHVYKATVALRRGLRRGEIVHHIDGNPANNVSTNLLVCTNRYHHQLHARLATSPDWPQFPARASRRPKCSECGTPIIYGSRSGLCLQHYWGSVRTTARQCRAPGCEKQSGFRSGLCLDHIKHRTNKRRFHKDWDFAA